MRYVFRYNNMTFGTPRASISPIFDAHGDTTNSHYATMGVEVYGNKITFTRSDGGGNLLNQRGGRAVCFYNKANNIASSYLWSTIWEEEPDWHQPTNTSCPLADPNYPNSGCDIQGYPEHVNNSYYWNNRGGANEVVNATIDMITGGPGGTATWDTTHLYDSSKDFRGYYVVGDGPGIAFALFPEKELANGVVSPIVERVILRLIWLGTRCLIILQPTKQERVIGPPILSMRTHSSGTTILLLTVHPG